MREEDIIRNTKMT